MTESHRRALATACAFAHVFLASADREARGGDPVPREEAQAELRAALRALEPYNPRIDQPSTQPYPQNPQTAADVRRIRKAFDKERASWT